MAFADANVPPNHVDRRCDNCDAAMKQLALLPAQSARAAVKVFRCYVCNHVASDRA